MATHNFCVNCVRSLCNIFSYDFKVGPNYKEDKELILYPNKGGKVADILEEAAKVVEMSPDGSRRLVWLKKKSWKY